MESKSDALLPPSVFSQSPQKDNLQLMSPNHFGKPKETERTLDLKPLKSSASNHQQSPKPVVKAQSLAESTPNESIRQTDANQHGQDELVQEIQQLRQANYFLMNENVRTIYENFEKQRSHQACHEQTTEQNFTKQHLDLLVSKLVEEITLLNRKLLDSSNSHEEQLSQIVKDNRMKEKEMADKLENLRIQLEQENLQHQQLLENSNRIYQTEVESLRAEVEKLTSQAARDKEMLVGREHEIINKSNQLDGVQCQLVKAQSELDGKDEMIRGLKIQMESLQKQVGDKERWPSTRRMLETKVQQLEDERCSLKSDIENLNLRLSAINEVLSAQEDSIRIQSATGKEPGEQRQQLLERWRTKVFQLLVQQKSKDLVTQRSNENYEMIENKLTSEINALKSKVYELENVVKERETHIASLKKSNQSQVDLLDRLNDQLHHMNLNLQETEDRNHQLANLIVYFDQVFKDQLQHLKPILSRLDQYEDRIICAASHLDKLHGTVLQLKNDNQSLSEQFANSQHLLAGSEAQRKVITEKLFSSEQTVKRLSIKIEELQGAITILHNDGKENEDKIFILQNEITKLSAHKDTEMAKLQVELEKDYKGKLDQCNQTISNLRRDLAKTVLRLRQTERKSDSTSEKYKEDMKQLCEDNSLKVTQLQRDLHKIQVEKMILQCKEREQLSENQNLLTDSERS